MHPVLRFVPLDPAGGDRAEAAWNATPARLTWDQRRPAGSTLVYESADTVRLRGRNLDLVITPAAAELTPFSGTYFYRDPVDGSYRSPPTRRAAATGSPSWKARSPPRQDWRDWAAPTAVLILSGAAGLGSRHRGDRQRAAALHRPGGLRRRRGRRTAAPFRDFADAVAPWPADHAPAAELAAYVLWSATVRPAGYLRRPAVLMSKHWMDKVWSWDHCFNALALAPGLPDLAWDQFQLPFDHQDETGALPDSVTHSEVLYNFVKPPIHGWALRPAARTPAPPTGA